MVHFWATYGYAQDLVLALDSGITPDRARDRAQGKKQGQKYWLGTALCRQRGMEEKEGKNLKKDLRRTFDK